MVSPEEFFEAVEQKQLEGTDMIEFEEIKFMMEQKPNEETLDNDVIIKLENDNTSLSHNRNIKPNY